MALNLIFAELVKMEPKAIGPILLVSHRWYEIVSQTPSLWTTIHLTFGLNLESIRLETQYVQSAIRNSEGRPLDVSISFPHLSDLWTSVARQMCPSPQGPTTFTSQYNRRDIRQVDVVDWFDNVSKLASRADDMGELFGDEEEEMQTFYPIPLSSIFQEPIHGLVTAISGVNGSNLARIRSLKIRLKSDELKHYAGEQTFRCFDYPEQDLESFSLIDETNQKIAIDPRFPLRTRKRFQSLSWCTIQKPTWTKKETLSPISLRCHGFNMEAGWFKHCLRNIQTLVVVYQDEIDIQYPPVELPALQDLTIVGELMTSVLTNIRAPNLKILRLPWIKFIHDGYNNLPDLEFPVPRIRSLEKLHVDTSLRIPSMSKISEEYPQLKELGLVHSKRLHGNISHKHMSTERIQVKRYSYDRAWRWELESCDAYESVPLASDQVELGSFEDSGGLSSDEDSGVEYGKITVSCFPLIA
jgi:hypothetical protein